MNGVVEAAKAGMVRTRTFADYAGYPVNRPATEAPHRAP